VWRGGGGTSAAKKGIRHFYCFIYCANQQFVNFYSRKSFNVREQNEQKNDPVSARIF